MTIAQRNQNPTPEGKLWRRLLPFLQSGGTTTTTTTTTVATSASSSSQTGGVVKPSSSVSSLAWSILPACRRLRLNPSNYIYFPYEPGRQVKSVVKIKNVSKSHVAFKFQTTAPKSCYMTPPGGIIAPGESLFATVFKFVERLENNEKHVDQTRKIKFKIVSVKVKEGTDYVPELFDEQRDQVTVERILRAVFINPNQPSSALKKLKRRLEEAEAAIRAPKKPPSQHGPRVGGGGLVIDEWKARRENYLARKKVESVDSSSSSTSTST